MIDTLLHMLPAALAAAETAPTVGTGPAQGELWWGLIPLLPLLGAALCLALWWTNNKSPLPAVAAVASVAVAFLLVVAGFLGWKDAAEPSVTTLWQWISFTAGDGGTFAAGFGFYLDGLSWLWMLFVTGLASLIALYASEYMSHDYGKGYCRFFGAFCLFVFSMACLVMGDNLLMLYLGWEGVGLCSYMLIGYFYKKPEAVAAAKKAFIVNRIGDLGLALGLFLTFTTYGSIEYAEIFANVAAGIDGSGEAIAGRWETWAIPCLLMIGAFGKSAQFPLFVWLPDAMEGPTPVSALIHAATMVTAGVYLIARFFPVFALDEAHIALTTVAWVGGITAFLAATIGMAQFDIKRIMAYSTVSQLGYMFAGIGVLTSTGAVYHVFTHAFFKAMLFLACGAVMHGFAGQLDLRKLSGLWSQKGWKITTVAMFIGCLNLAGVPFMAGYWSKDMILAETFAKPGMAPLGWLLLLTAGMTAYYTFRVFFRVFVGKPYSEPGDELHDHDDDHGHGEESHHDVGEQGDHHGAGFHPHAPGLRMNIVLGTLAVLTLLASFTYIIPANTLFEGMTKKQAKHVIAGFVYESSANQKPVHDEYYDQSHSKDGHGDKHDDHTDDAHSGAALSYELIAVADDHGHGDHDDHAAYDDHGKAHHQLLFGQDPHKIMYYVSAVFGVIGILVAAFLHGPKGPAGLFIGGRTEAATSRADGLMSAIEKLPVVGAIPSMAQHKWYIDEIYGFIIVGPLRFFSHLFHMLDKLVVDGIVNGIGALPGAIARLIRPSQDGVLHTYATGMALGVAVILLVVWIALLGGGAG